MKFSALLRLAPFIAFFVAATCSRGQAISTLHPEKVLGSESCAQCHRQEIEAWTLSTHHRSDSVMRDPKTKDRAKVIATNLGISVNSIATDRRCTECHFTRQKTTALKVIGGVSCESCHGGAKDYLKIHGDLEKIPSREARQTQSKEAGLLYPQDIYLVAENCFSCHIARDEQLVNKGGHHPRSEGFDLVTWSQGEVRHNFYDENLKRNEKVNREATSNSKRMLFTVGLLLDLEHSLRGLAEGKERGNTFPFRQAMGRRAFAIIGTELPALVEKVGGASAPAELQMILEIAKAVNLGADPATMEKAADDIKAQTQAFGKQQDGSKLGGMDALIPKTVKGVPYTPKG